jgi:tryptophan synthase alpha chain
LSTTERLVRAAVDTGADVVEIGMPFSDPLADGPEIQYSSHQALTAGTAMRDILNTVERIRGKVEVPLILMGYLNPVLAFGVKRFVRVAAGVGVDGYIIPDLPHDDAGELQTAAEERGQSMVYLVAPTTTRRRLTEIDLGCTDFVYAVTVTGVTGTGKRFDRATDRYLRHMRKMLSKPFVAGFGVSSVQTAKRLSRYADGVVIGSALVRLMREARNRRDGVSAVVKLLSAVRRAV